MFSTEKDDGRMAERELPAGVLKPVSSKKPMDVGINSIGTIFRDREDPPEKGFRAIAEAGFDTVDFNFEMFSEYDSLLLLDGSCFYDRSPSWLEDYFRPYRKACQDYGLRFSQGHCPFCRCAPPNTPQWDHYVEVIKKCLTLAGFMGIPYMVVHPMIMRPEYTLKEEREANLALGRALTGTAREAGVVICFENMFRSRKGKLYEASCSDAAEAAGYIDELNEAAGEERFGFCLDFGHLTLLGKDVYEFIQTLGSRIRILHLHDNDGIRDLHALPFSFSASFCGEPIADWEGLIKGLRETGYKNAVNFETTSCMYNVPEQLCQATRRYIREIGVYLAGRIGDV